VRNRKQALQVGMNVREPSVVELTVHERVQIDRVHATARGPVAERHGALLEPGVRTIALAPGQFFFKTMSDAELRVVSGGVTVTEGGGSGKSLPPKPTNPANGDPDPTPLGVKGDDPPGSRPTLIVS
jgi:hypothetical protein